MHRFLVIPKITVVLSIVGLLATSYFLRWNVLTLINHSMAAAEIAADERAARFREGSQARSEAFAAELARYKLSMEKYLAALTATNKKVEQTPEEQRQAAYREQQQYQRETQVPPKPTLEQSPETRERIATISDQFRQDQVKFFTVATRLNWVVGVMVMLLVGSLLTLIMFDAGGPRVAYVAVLILSFVFFIGPALYSFLAAFAWRMEPPKYDQTYSDR
jgi:hypothetical protein